MSDPNKPNPPAKSEKVKARVLVAGEIDGAPVQPDDVVLVSADAVKSLAGQIDANPAAVKYAEGLKRNKAKPAEEEEA